MKISLHMWNRKYNYKRTELDATCPLWTEEDTTQSTSAANEYYSSVSHHEQKNKKIIGQIKLSAVNKITNKTSLNNILYINKC